jgi:hypothetical protein
VATMLDGLLGLLPVRLRRKTVITTQLSQSAFLARYASAPLLHLLSQSAVHASIRRADHPVPAPETAGGSRP